MRSKRSFERVEMQILYWAFKKNNIFPTELSKKSNTFPTELYVSLCVQLEVLSG